MNTEPEIDIEQQNASADGEQPQQPVTNDLAADLEKFRDLALRSRAELDNYRKRVAREKEDAIRYANSSLL